MQTYVVENHLSSAPKKVVRPNIHKVFVRNLIYVSGIAAGIILLMVFLDNVVGLETFLMPFEALDITVNTDNLLLISIMVFLGAAIAYLAANYLSIMSVRYEFYDNRMKIFEPVLFVFLTPKEIPYKNIVKISYDYVGFMNKLLNSGEINIEVTGMKEGSLKMEVLDNTEELVNNLLNIVKEYNSLQQMQFEENRKINNIMRKF